jgi:hypothetical protein
MAEFKRGDKFIIELGNQYESRGDDLWKIVGAGFCLPEGELRHFPRYYEEPAEGVEVPDVVFQVMIARADELLEQVKVLEKERDKIMDFLHSAKRSHEK